MENHPTIIGLYKEEIETYKQQIDELKARNRSCDDKNAALINRVRNLEDLVEKANIANKDLHDAFEHVRKENMKLQVHQGNHEPVLPVIPEPEHEVALENAQRQFVNLARESVSWISDKDRMTQRIKFLERECDRYNRDCTTLGKQVRHLLRSLEEERGMIIRRQSQVTEDQQISCAADVIDKHLVTFESIEELQRQNQKLTSLVKEMSAREEERETQLESEEVKKLNQDLEALKSQLESIKNDRENILNAFNTIHKERDLFKILLTKTRQVEHLTPEIFQRMVSVAVSAGPAITDATEDTVDKDAHISDLKSMISKLEQELTDLRSYLEEIRTRSDEEVKLKADLLEKAHMKILDEVKRADVLNERNEVLEGNLTTLTTEYDETRTRCQKMTFEVEQLKSQNEELTNNLSKIEKQNQELSKALEQEKESRQRLSYEVEQSREQRDQLIHTFEMEKQSRQAELESLVNGMQEKQIRDIEIRTAKQLELQAKVSEYERELLNLKNELAQQGQAKDTNSQTAIRELETKISNLLNQLELKDKQIEQLQSEVSRMNELQSRLAQLSEADSRGSEKVRQLEMELDRKAQLEQQLSTARDQILAFQALRNEERTYRLKITRQLSRVKPRRIPRPISDFKRKERPPPELISHQIYNQEQEQVYDTAPSEHHNKISEDVPNEASNEVDNYQPRELCDQVYDQELDQAPEQTCHQVPEQVLDPVQGQILDQGCDQICEQICDNVCDQVSEQPVHEPMEQHVDMAQDSNINPNPCVDTEIQMTTEEAPEETPGETLGEVVGQTSGEKVFIKLKRRNIQ